MVALDTTKSLLQLTTELHSLNNKLYQLKINSEVFVVDKCEYNSKMKAYQECNEVIKDRIRNIVGELK